MPENAGRDWIELPENCFVSASRICRNGKMFTLYDASKMWVLDVMDFKDAAKKFGIHMGTGDLPVQKFVKYLCYLSENSNDNSFLPANETYVGMLADVAVAKSGGQEPLTSFCKTLTDGTWDFVGEIIEFHEKLVDSRYKVELLRFNRTGELCTVGDITVAGEGWIRALDDFGYPAETSPDECAIENIENPDASAIKLKGYWSLGVNPAADEQRLVLHRPSWGGRRMLDTNASMGPYHSHSNVGAVMMRSYGKPPVEPVGPRHLIEAQ